MSDSTVLLSHLPAQQRTIPAMLTTRAQRMGDRPLLRTDDLGRSYAQMATAVSIAAGTLAEFGIGVGDRVAIMSENRVELLDLMLACGWIGAAAVPLNTALRGPGLEHQLSDSGARLLILEGDLAESLRRITVPVTLEAVWLLDGDVPAGLDLAIGAIPASPGSVAAADVRPGDTAAILYTSGTTGPAKGVQCPHAQFYWWGVQMAEQLEVDQDDVLYTALPVYHVNAFGAFFQALVAGATFYLGPRFSASQLFARLDAAGATVTYLLGAMVSIVESRPPSAADRAHRVTRALAPSCSAAQMETFQDRFGIELVEAYGSTETNAAIGAPRRRQRAGWMGPVRSGFEARVVDVNDEALPDGTVGELVIRSRYPYALSSGYFRAPAMTVEAWRNLWFHTGDLVERSPDGWFRFRDRISDSIRRRGENISSYEVEQSLLSHPEVEQAAAYAVPSELGEDDVAAAVVLAAGADVEAEELIRWCEGRLAYFAIPRYVRLMDELPMTENGKVRKEALRADGVEACWDRDAAGVVVARAGM